MGIRRAAAAAAGGCSGKGDQRETQCDTLNQLCKHSSVSNSIDHYVPRDGGGRSVLVTVVVDEVICWLVG